MLKRTNSIHRFFFLLIVCFASFYANSGYGLVWNTPPEAFVTNDNAISFGIASDPQGNSLTVSSQWDDLVASYFNAATGSYEPIYILDSGNLFSHVAVAMDASGNGIAVWSRSFTDDIQAAQFTNGTWGPPTVISTGSDIIPILPEVAMDGLGNGIAVWRAGLSADMYSATFSNATATWSAPIPVGIIGEGTVAYAPSGEAIAGNGIGDISLFDGVSWTAFSNIGLNQIGPPGMDAAGNGLIVGTDILGNLLYIFYDGSTFSSALPVFLGSGNTGTTFAMSENGTAVFGYNDGTSDFYTVFNGTTWGLPLPNNGGQVAVDSVGNAIFLWDDGLNIFSNSLPSGGTLGPTDTVALGVISWNFSIRPALSDNGRAFTAWATGEDEGPNLFGTYSLLAEPPLPPDSINGFSCNNKFAFQTDYVHIITWTASPDSTVTSYYVRRNGVLVAVVPAGSPYVYEDHNQSRHVAVTYSVTAVGDLGESLPLSIQLR